MQKIVMTSTTGLKTIQIGPNDNLIDALNIFIKERIGEQLTVLFKILPDGNILVALESKRFSEYYDKITKNIVQTNRITALKRSILHDYTDEIGWIICKTKGRIPWRLSDHE